MDKNEIIRMALEVGVKEYGPLTRNWSFGLSQLERFAALVAAHEREACAKVCDDIDKHFEYTIAARQCAAVIRARNMHSLLPIDYEALNDE